MMDLEEVKRLTCLASLNDMMAKPFFSICAVTDVAEVMDIQVRGSSTFTILKALHCIEWNKMDPRLRQAVPELIKECLRLPTTYQFRAEQFVIPEDRKKFLGFGR